MVGPLHHCGWIHLISNQVTSILSNKNPTGHCKEDGESIHFVDDGTVTFSHHNPEVVSRVLTSHYAAIADYMAANKLVINDDKTHLMVMAPTKLEDKRKEVLIQAGNFTIKPTESQKLLGVGIHQSMEWKHHIRDDKDSVLK